MLGHGYKDPVPYQNAYASSKIWVRWFTQTLAEETKATGVGVFAYNPGMVLTDLLTHGEVIQGSRSGCGAFLPSYGCWPGRRRRRPTRPSGWPRPPPTARPACW